HWRAAGPPRARAAQPAAGIPALAGGARPQGRGRGRDIAERKRNAEGDRTAAAAGASSRIDLRQSRVLVRSLRPLLSAPHAGGVGDLVCGLFRELWAVDLVAHVISNRVQAAARCFATLRFDHAGGRPARHADLRVDYRSCRAAALVRRLLHGCGVGFGRARALPRADRGAGADLHDYRFSLLQPFPYRPLSLPPPALSPPPPTT